MLMNELFDRYDAECIPNLFPRSQRDYKGILLILRDTFGHIRPQDITRRDINKFLDVKKGRIHRNRMVTILSAVFSKAITRWCPDEDLRNPCYRVERWPTKPRKRDVADEEFHSFRAICPAQVQLAMDLAALTPLGQKEILGLRWQQVCMTGVPRTEWVIDPAANRSRTRPRIAPIPITPPLEVILNRARSMEPAFPREYVIRTNPPRGNPLKRGDRYTEDGFRALWQRCMREYEKGGRPRFHFGDLHQKVRSASVLAPSTLTRSPLSSRTNSKIFWASIIVQEPIPVPSGISAETFADQRTNVECGAPDGDCIIVYCCYNQCGAIYWIGRRMWSMWAPIGPAEFVTLLQINNVTAKDPKEFAEWRKASLDRRKTRGERPLILPDEIDQCATGRPNESHVPRQRAGRS